MPNLIYEPKFITIYTAFEEIDQTEGRGGSRKLGHFYSKEDAELAADGKGVMGSRGRVVAQSYLTLDGITGYPVDPKSKVNLQTLTKAGTVRTRALKKLTVEERKALGL
jgi:hypothetical protein